MQNLVGQTVKFSPKDRKDGGNKTRTIYVIRETIYDGRRYYVANDTDGGESFYADADKYDEYFLVRKSQVKPNHHREAIQNKSQIGYKK